MSSKMNASSLFKLDTFLDNDHKGDDDDNDDEDDDDDDFHRLINLVRPHKRLLGSY